MNNKTYSDSVQFGQYPSYALVPLDEPFINNNGYIQNLLNAPINGAAIIYSKAGAIRSNHWHREDMHYLYILNGSCEYYERNIDQDGRDVKPLFFKAGDMIFTPPNKVHKVVYLEDTLMVSLSKRNRDHDSHEEDVVRVEF